MLVWRVRGLVGLRPLDPLGGLCGYAIDHSLKPLSLIALGWRSITDRKLVLLARRPAVSENQLPDKVIQTGPPIVRDVPCDDARPERRGALD
jgi:hypothetical protein